MKRYSFLILLLSALFLIPNGCREREIYLTGGVLQGVVLDSDDNPIYGAKVQVNDTTVTTDRFGEFKIEDLPMGEVEIKVSGYGYYNYTEKVNLEEESGTKKIKLRSWNKDLLYQIGNPQSFEEIKKAFEYSGFIVANDTSISKAFANAHINGVKNMLDLHKDITLSQIAEDLSVQGIRLGGQPLSSSKFVSLLQALVNAAYKRPDDPRLFFPLYLVSSKDGSLPSTPPSLTEETKLDPVRATALYAVIMYLAEHPIAGIQYPLESYKVCSHNLTPLTPQDWAEDVLGLLSIYPIPPNPEDYDSFEEYLGAGTAKLVGSFAGGLVGMYLGSIIGGGLTVATGGTMAWSIPFFIAGGKIVGSWLGGKLALWIYKVLWDKVGETIRENPGVYLEEDGNIGFDADIRVTLTWEGGPLTDVDLHVTDPNGEECWYGHMDTEIGGELDVDDVDGYGPENFTLERGEAIDGDYLIEINYYDDEGTPGEPIVAKVVVHLNEGTPYEIVQTYGPHTILKCDHNGTDPEAWWTVGTIHWPTGSFKKALPPVTRFPLPPKWYLGNR